MQSEDNRIFRWLMIGALIGAFAVILAIEVARLQLSGWFGALVPTLSAILFGTIGPRARQKVNQEQLVPYSYGYSE